MPFFPNLFFPIILLILTGCVSPKYRCDQMASSDCSRAKAIWQKAIDLIVSANFPNEYGKYRGVIWQDSFDNAWVTKGREVNITQQFLFKLTSQQILCVAAHELAHLKMGHYYAKMGIIIITPENPVLPQKSKGSHGHYGAQSNIHIPEGFGRNQEKEADRLALEYIKSVGLNRYSYIGLLNLLIDDRSNTGSPMMERIRSILVLGAF